MLNTLMAQEAIASTAIEYQSFDTMDQLNKVALTVFVSSNGEMSYADCLKIAKIVMKVDDSKPLDNYLNGRTIEECIMGAAQEVIDNFETTYDKKRYGDEPTGYWKAINHMYVYHTYDNPLPYEITGSSLQPA